MPCRECGINKPRHRPSCSKLGEAFAPFREVAKCDNWLSTQEVAKALNRRFQNVREHARSKSPRRMPWVAISQGEHRGKSYWILGSELSRWLETVHPEWLPRLAEVLDEDNRHAMAAPKPKVRKRAKYAQFNFTMVNGKLVATRKVPKVPSVARQVAMANQKLGLCRCGQPTEVRRKLCPHHLRLDMDRKRKKRSSTKSLPTPSSLSEWESLASSSAASPQTSEPQK